MSQLGEASSESTAWPPEFVRRNGADPAFMHGLPGLLADLASRWSLTVEPWYPGIKYNYVAPAVRTDGVRCVLKVSRFVQATRSEIAALRLWDGDGAARLLDAEPDVGALLIERVEPGAMLSEEAASSDDSATLVVAGLLRRLWRPVPPDADLIPLERWCAAYDRNRHALAQGARGFPAGLFQRADAVRRDLLLRAEAPLVLHGDMQHFNVLRSHRSGWLAIDPKGLVGDPCFDLCQFLRNPLPEGVSPAVSGRRLDILSDVLGLDRQRIKDWCLVHAILDACWDFEEGQPWERATAYAESTLSF